jgi:long-subunit fatty acid transport protein
MKVQSLPSLLSLGVLLFSSSSSRAVTVYYQVGAQAALASGAGTGAAANYTGAAAYNPTTLNPPSPPGPTAMPTNFAIQPIIAVPPGASIPQKGSFFGFSVEMSVVNQVGKFVVYPNKKKIVNLLE